MSTEYDTGGFSSAKENILWRLTQLEQGKKETDASIDLLEDRIAKQDKDQAVMKARLVIYAAISSQILDKLTGFIPGVGQ